MLTIASRNLKIFFRDRSAVFFSLLAVFIIIGLYVLFLGDTLQSSMSELKGVRFLMDSWIMAGLLAVTSVTTTMGAFGIMVDDRAKKNFKDFYASPLKRSDIAGGYILSSFLIGLIMTVISFILAEIYILTSGGELLPFISLLKVLGLILISVLSSSAMIFFMVSFFKSTNAFATASTIVGTLIGFLTGIYIPIGSLPDAVQLVVKIFPVSHAGVLFRQVFMEKPLQETFEGIPTEKLADFKDELGVVFHYGDFTAGTGTHLLVLIITTLVFFGLAVWNISRKSS